MRHVPRPTPVTSAALRPTRRLALFAALLLLIANLAGCQSSHSATTATPAPASTGPTSIVIGARVLHSGVKRLGINLSGQSYYDSGQMLRDISYRNPGFEGELWQTILQCKFVQENACADNDEWSAWPADFAKGASFEFFFGAAKGQTGAVATTSVAASSAHQGVWVNFGHLAVQPKAGDFYILRMKIPGGAETGWWPGTTGGGSISTEFKDLSPLTPGKQAVRLTAIEPSQTAALTSNIDSWTGKSFLQMNGVYTISFRAKGVGGSNQLSVSVARLNSKGNYNYFARTVALSPAWKDYQFTFPAHEDGTRFGPIQFNFTVQGAAALIDDASLTEPAAPDNPTAFRNAVVTRLRELHPGILRYMDNGTNFGSTIDNLIAPAYARQRSGSSEGGHLQEDAPIGLHDFLVLCQAIGAEPWFTMPAAETPEEARNLIEYLAGPATSPYGAKRAKLGQSAPWTQIFPAIHLELGNETWNPGAIGENTLNPVAYATRTAVIFAAAKAAPFYDKSRFDLIMDGWASVPWWNEQELSIPTSADTIDIAPYTFYEFNDASSPEAVFGPMFAEPEALDSRPEGLVAAQAKVAAKAGVRLAIYEVNLSTVRGNATQSQLDAAVPSVGAGLSVADHMLLMLRDQGIVNQALFCLPEFENGFANTANPNAKEAVKLWGTVVDMGGETNRVRPTFLAEALANSAILPSMLETTISGSNPTWDQPESANGKIKLSGAHLLQSFAFTDGTHFSLILLNLSRSVSLPVTFSGPNAPRGQVEIGRLTSAHISDTNETAQTVATTHQTLASFNPAAPYALPPYSMTVLTWKTK